MFIISRCKGSVIYKNVQEENEKNTFFTKIFVTYKNMLYLCTLF